MYIHMHMGPQLYDIYIYIYTCMYVCMYVYTYTYIYIYICIDINIWDPGPDEYPLMSSISGRFPVDLGNIMSCNMR